MEERKNKNVYLIIIIVLLLIIILGLVYMLYLKQDSKTSDSNKKDNNPTEVKDEDNEELIGKDFIVADTIKANTSQKIMDILKENDVVGYDDKDNIIWKKSNIILDYGKIKNHTVKINLLINEGDSSEKCKLITYIDDKNYIISDEIDYYTMKNLIEYLEVTSNKIGILLINKVPYGYSIQPFILIYNDKKLVFEKITNITTTYKKEWSTPVDRNNKKIYHDDNYIYYYKYDVKKEKKNYCDGKTDVIFVKYDGEKEETIEEFNDVYIHEIYC